MASPQLENGHIQIAHEVFEALIKSHITSTEYSVFLAILRSTWGWKKKTHTLTVSFLAKATGCPPRSVQHALTLLEKRKMIIREWSETGPQKDWEKWQTTQPIAPCNTLHPATHCVETTQPIAGLTTQPIAYKKESIKEKRKKEVPPKERSVLTECRQFSFDDFQKRLGQKPAWATKDYVQLSKLFERLPELTFDEWKTRWFRFATSTDPFDIKMGLSLGFFSTNFDRFIKDIPKPSSTRFQPWDRETSYQILMQEEPDDKTRVS